MQFKLDPLPAELAEICPFHKRCIKIMYYANIWSIVNKIWSRILQKNEWFKFTPNIWQLLHKTTLLLALTNEKQIFRTTKMKTSFGKLIAHSNMHPFAQYEIIWENYPFKLALTPVIWLESHEPSHSIAHFERTFLTYLHYYKFVGLYG